MNRLILRRVLFEFVIALATFDSFRESVSFGQSDSLEYAPPNTFIAASIDVGRIRESMKLLPKTTRDVIMEHSARHGGFGPIAVRAWLLSCLGLNCEDDIQSDEYAQLFRESYSCDRVDLDQVSRATVFVALPKHDKLAFFGTTEEVTTLLQFTRPMDSALFVETNSVGFECSPVDSKDQLFVGAWRNFGIDVSPPSFFFSEAKSSVAISSKATLESWRTAGAKVESRFFVPPMAFEDQYQVFCKFDFHQFSESDKRRAWSRILTKRILEESEFGQLVVGVESCWICINLAADRSLSCEIEWVGDVEARRFKAWLEDQIQRVSNSLVPKMPDSNSAMPQSVRDELAAILGDISIVQHGPIVEVNITRSGGIPVLVHLIGDEFAESFQILNRVRRMR